MLLGDLGETFTMTTGNVWLKSVKIHTLHYRIRYSKRKNIHSYTCHQERKYSKLVIDLIIISQSTSSTIKDVKIYRDTDCGSVNYLVKGKIQWRSLKNKTKIFSEQTEVNYY